jgi:molybdenum cofactor cytidylyltransferase
MTESMGKEAGYGIVVLGAGSSSRLGSPKQLLVFKGLSLIRRAANIALEITQRVVVVTGAEAAKVQEEVKDLPLAVIHNKDFKEGIASSLRLGLSALVSQFTGLKGVIFTVCDQPYLSSDVLKQLINSAESSDKGIICCGYGGSVGIPVLFKGPYFNLLRNLRGDFGAKRIVQTHLSDTITIDFPAGDKDIDTPEDWQALISEAEAKNAWHI